MDFLSCKDLPVWAQILVGQEPSGAQREVPHPSSQEECLLEAPIAA